MDNETLVLAKQYTNRRVDALGNVLNFKGIKATVADLPSTGNKVGDVWAVTADNCEYVWTTNNAWEKLGSNVVIAYTPMKSDWCGDNLTTAQAINLMKSDTDTVAGQCFIGGVEWSDLHDAIGLYNGEATAYLGPNKSFVIVEITSSNVSPYIWFFNSYAGEWRSFIDLTWASGYTSGTEQTLKHDTNGKLKWVNG